MFRGLRRAQTALMIAGGYIGAAVGGGFATGRELLHFFLEPTRGTPVFLTFTTAAFITGGALLMNAVIRSNVRSQREVGALFCVSRGGRSLIDAVLVVFFWAVLAVVLSAAGALIAAEGVSAPVGSAAAAAIICGVVLGGRRTTALVNGLLVVALVMTILRAHLSAPQPAAAVLVEWPATLNPVLYTSYNLLFVLAVFPGLARRERWWACVLGAGLGGLFLGLMCAAASLVMAGVYRHVAGAPVPLQVALALVAPALGGAYPVIAGLALITTGIALMHGLAHRVGGGREPDLRSVLTVILPAMAGSQVPLTELVATVYPAMAWISLFLWGQLARRALSG